MLEYELVRRFYNPLSQIRSKHLTKLYLQVLQVKHHP